MDATRTYVKIYNIEETDAQDFGFYHDTASSDLLTELVPDLDSWGDVGWMELEEYDYDPRDQTMPLPLETGTHYFANKLITMTTIQKDETCVTGVAVMDGEILQNKLIFELTSEEVERYYNDEETEYQIDTLDNNIWDSIAKFATVCEQFYLEREQSNDD